MRAVALPSILGVLAAIFGSASPVAAECAPEGPTGSHCLYRSLLPSTGIVASCRDDRDCRVGYYYGDPGKAVWIEPPNKYRMAIEGIGGPGFVRGDAGMELSDAEGGTRVSYSAEVQVGGLIASVGQRMLGGVSKMMLDQFFAKMTELLAASK